MIINPKVVKKGISEEQLQEWSNTNTQLEQNVGTYATTPSTLSKLQLMVSGQPFSLSKYDLQGITEFGQGAFSYSGITAVDIPDGFTNIEESAFYQCESLTKVTIPSSVTNIKIQAFYQCESLTEVIIPSNVTSISPNGFRYCTSLTSITVLAEVPPTISSNTFSNGSPDAVFYVPDASVDAYKQATNWVQYADQIQPLSAKGGTNQ